MSIANQAQQAPDKQDPTFTERQKAILQETTVSRGFFYNLGHIITSRISLLFETTLGDSHYKPRNEYSTSQKAKILRYLDAKLLSISTQMQEAKREKFTYYNPQFYKEAPKNINHLKEIILHGKTQVQAAKASLQRLQFSKKQLKGRYLSQMAYEFDKQRYNAMCWGAMLGCAINGSIYRFGKTVRQVALFLLITHLFSQSCYRNNLDRYFDGVVQLFQEEAIKFSMQDIVEANKTKLQGAAAIEE